MSCNEMRERLKKLYKGAYKWRNKVNHMTDSQVVAVYYSMKKRGQL